MCLKSNILALQSTHRLRALIRGMASTSHTNTPARAPWRESFLEHLNTKMESPEFVLSSLHPAPPGSPVPYVPHARYCIFRGLWAELPENKHNDAPKNERVYESDLPTFTTDARMEKVPEIFGSSAGKMGEDGKSTPHGGSGGGGPIEAVWWVKDIMVQWRIKGEAFVVAPDVETDAESSGVRTVKSEVGKRMRILKEEGVQHWSWGKEVTGHFGNLSPGMRGESDRLLRE